MKTKKNSNSLKFECFCYLDISGREKMISTAKISRCFQLLKKLHLLWTFFMTNVGNSDVTMLNKKEWINFHAKQILWASRGVKKITTNIEHTYCLSLSNFLSNVTFDVIQKLIKNFFYDYPRFDTLIASMYKKLSHEKVFILSSISVSDFTGWCSIL